MKKPLLVLSVAAVLSVIGFAQTPTPTPVVQPVVQTVTQPVNVTEEIKSAKQILSSIADSKDPEHKTFGDVLDKGIDLFASYATSLGELVKKIAPEVFAIMVRQQYAKAISNIAYWTFLPLLFVVLPFAFRKLRHGAESSKFRILQATDDSDGEEFRMIVSWASVIVFGILSCFALYFITESVTMLINPKYFAIKDMIDLIKK